MSRLDHKAHGRFSADAETARIYEGMRGWKEAYGDWIQYYVLDSIDTQYDDVYEEAAGTGVNYSGPIALPCLHVDHVRGGNQMPDTGFYYNDTLEATVPYNLYVTSGMNLADVDTGNYMRDRVVYNQKVFRVTSLSIRGKIQQRPTIVVLNATQVKPDELVDSPVFEKYANLGSP